MRSLAALASMGLAMAGDDFLFGPEPYAREKREPGSAQPEKSNRRAEMAAKAERRRQRNRGDDHG